MYEKCAHHTQRKGGRVRGVVWFVPGTFVHAMDCFVWCSSVEDVFHGPETVEQHVEF